MRKPLKNLLTNAAIVIVFFSVWIVLSAQDGHRLNTQHFLWKTGIGGFDYSNHLIFFHHDHAYQAKLVGRDETWVRSRFSGFEKVPDFEKYWRKENNRPNAVVVKLHGSCEYFMFDSGKLILVDCYKGT